GMTMRGRGGNDKKGRRESGGETATPKPRHPRERGDPLCFYKSESVHYAQGGSAPRAHTYPIKPAKSSATTLPWTYPCSPGRPLPHGSDPAYPPQSSCPSPPPTDRRD